MRRTALAVLLSSCVATAATAQLVPPQNSQPMATPKIDSIPAPRDVPYPGTLTIDVDARDTARAVFHVKQTITDKIYRKQRIRYASSSWLENRKP